MKGGMKEGYGEGWKWETNKRSGEGEMKGGNERYGEGGNERYGDGRKERWIRGEGKVKWKEERMVNQRVSDKK